MDDTQIPFDEVLSPEQWKEKVHSCFEILQARGTPLAVETLEGVEMEGVIESLDAIKGRMVLSIPRTTSAGLDPDDTIRLFFTMDENRWVGLARIHYHNDRRNRFTLILPPRLDPSDRRRELRVFLDPSENIKATFHPLDADHLLITGRLSNLSEGGFRVAVESALDADRGRALDPGDLLLEARQLLTSVRLTGLRNDPVETEGIVLDVDPQPLGPILGVRFRSMPQAELRFLRAFVQSRNHDAPAPFPQLLDLPQTETTAIPVDAIPRKEAPMLDVSPADQRLKRFRTVGLVMPPVPGREALQDFLSAQGFTRIQPAGTLAEIAAMTRKTAPDAFLVDWPGGEAQALDIALFLGNHPFPAPPRIILACLHATAQLAKEAHRLGVSHLLVKPYALDEALVGLLLQQLRGDDQED